MVGQFGIAKPMRALVALLQRLAKGEDVEITGTERQDEIGETARAVNGIKDMLAEKARHEAEAKITQESINDIREISGTIEKLSEISSTIAAAVEERGAATQEISRNVQQAAPGTEQVSSNISDVPAWRQRNRLGFLAGSIGGAVTGKRQ
jgi:methyl-accepting chemotaxis protein